MCCKNLVCSVFCVSCKKNFIFLFLGLCVRTYLRTVDRMLGAAFDLALVTSTAAPQPALTLMRPAFDFTVVSSTVAHLAHAHTQAHLRSNLPCKFERRAICTTCARHECGRTHLCAFKRTRAGPFQDLFLGHLFPIFPIFPIRPYASPPLLLRSPLPITSQPPSVPPPASLRSFHPPPAAH
jgi:hypothetical protein